MTTAKQDSAKAQGLVGAIRTNAERIVEMHNGHYHCEDLGSSLRILELTEELSEAITLDMLTASRLLVALKKLMRDGPAYDDARALIAEIEGRQG